MKVNVKLDFDSLINVIIDLYKAGKIDEYTRFSGLFLESDMEFNKIRNLINRYFSDDERSMVANIWFRNHLDTYEMLQELFGKMMFPTLIKTRKPL
jgi:hypothetical protein